MNDFVDANELNPCEGICRVDPETGDCVGCGRPLCSPTTNDPAPLAGTTQEERCSADPVTS